MNNHFNVKLINFGLNFSNDVNCRLRVQDLIVPEKAVPIVLNQKFSGWVIDDYDSIGYATLYTENFNLYADCYFDYKIMLVQPSHDRIIIRIPSGYIFAFNSMSLLLDNVILEKSTQNDLIPLFIKAKIKNLSFVIDTADPGVFIFLEKPHEVTSLNTLETRTIPTNKALIFTGPTINKNILD